MADISAHVISLTQPTQRPLGVLCAEAGVACPLDAAKLPIGGISADSRRLQAGWLFVAIRGMRQNAARFIDDAISHGCAAVLCEASDCPPKDVPVPVLTVPDARVAMAYLFDAWYGHPARHLRLIGVTGTNGKTSTATMLRHILHTAGVPCGIIGTVGCRLPDGTALSVQPPDDTVHMTTPDPEELYPALAAMAAWGEAHPTACAKCGKPVVVMEVTSHALALGKVEPLHFDISLFTNLTPDHLDLHGDMTAYAAAKARLFSQTRVGVVNASDICGRHLADRPSAGVEKWLMVYPRHTLPLEDDRCARREDDDRTSGTRCERIYAEQVSLQGSDGLAYRLVAPTARTRITCPVPGTFTVENTLLAAATALDMGISPAVVRSALASFHGVPGRMERVKLPRLTPFTVFIDFAHTPDALEHLLMTAQDFRRPGQRIVLLFGCGGVRDATKRPVMGDLAVRYADRVVVTSDNSRTEDPDAIIEDILRGIDPAQRAKVEVIRDRTVAITHVVQTAEAGDIILLAGKGHEEYEIGPNGVKPFCEREIVRRVFGEKL